MALGSNVGDRSECLRFGVRELERLLRGVVVSSVYRSAPREGVRGPDFLNMCAAGRLPTGDGGPAAADEAAIHRFLRELQYVEMGGGRTPSRPPGESRTLDLDLLLVGDRVVDTAELTLPHPRMKRRNFVLTPLEELLPRWRHPEIGTTVRELSERAGDGRLRRAPRTEQVA